jgi:tetratricopeptide (TPR) repeat protein
MHPWLAALHAALDGTAEAAARLLAAAAPLLAQGSPAERASMLSGVARIADALNDPTTELEALRRAVAAQREVGDDREKLVQLSVMLYNLAQCHIRQNDYAAAEPLLAEVVALDEQTGHPDLESDREALAMVRRRVG